MANDDPFHLSKVCPFQRIHRYILHQNEQQSPRNNPECPILLRTNPTFSRSNIHFPQSNSNHVCVTDEEYKYLLRFK